MGQTWANDESSVPELKRIFHNESLLAIILPAGCRREGIHFFTDPASSIQLASMNHPAGHRIPCHRHNRVPREVQYTQEVLVIRKGRLRVDLYAESMEYVESHVLQAGDIILLVHGGHGFRALDDVDMVEIKQGPFAGEHDKTRFDATAVPTRLQD